MHSKTPIVFQIGNRQSALGNELIGNRHLALGNELMVRRPRLLPLLKGSNFGSVGDVPLRPPERNSRPIKGITPLGTLKRAVAGHVFKSLLPPADWLRLIPNRSSLRPFWHRVVVKPGQANHPFICDCRFPISN